MLDIIPPDKRHHADEGWLSSYFHFSFAGYYDPENISFGKLRVFNDDTIKPHTGFDTHPHKEMEIITYVISGEVTHTDSTGVTGVTREGELQRMSAGTGIFHSEYNNGDKPLHLLQIWIYPDKKGVKPSYEQKHFTKENMKGTFLPVVSGKRGNGTLFINQDVEIFLSGIYKGSQLTYQNCKNRLIYLFVIKGEIYINNNLIEASSSAKISFEKKLVLKAVKSTELILIDMPE